SFILHKFEAILSWAEFINLNRRVEEDENDDAKKAADDMDEIGLGQISKAPATRLKLHLDLAPEDVERERLSAETTYPEWDARTGGGLDAAGCIRARVGIVASGEGDARVGLHNRAEQRDRAVSILLDVSRSTESAVPGHGHEGRAVIDIEREALAALAWGLDACGGDFAVHAFSSLKRDRVYVQTAKRFGRPMASMVEARIASLKPCHDTR